MTKKSGGEEKRARENNERQPRDKEEIRKLVYKFQYLHSFIPRIDTVLDLGLAVGRPAAIVSDDFYHACNLIDSEPVVVISIC